MNDSSARVHAFREATGRLRSRHVDELRRLVEIPSVSAEGRGIEECADACVALLEERGMTTQVHRTPGNPIVVARGGRAGGRKLLMYEHYDVQPPDPLELWTTPPFELTEKDGNLFGRGSSDTKGHIMCRLAAVDICREVLGDDPVEYIFLIEGEEEIGSEHLEAFIEDHADELRADGCLWESGGVDEDGRPNITLGLKGIAGVDLRCRGPAFDLHSSLGAAIENPLYRLSAAIESLRDRDGRVLIDGFYDDVRPLGDGELEALRAHPDRSAGLREAFGVDGFLGSPSAFELLRRLQCEPCINVNGIHGGYGGPGGKTVLPAEGFAKLDIRLVPDQDPKRIVDLLRAHLLARGFADVEVVEHVGEAAGRTPLDDPFVKLVADAAREAYGLEPIVQVSSPGTGPAHPFRHILNGPFASVGCAYIGSRPHSPDEHIRIADFDTGRLHSALVAAAMSG